MTGERKEKEVRVGEKGLELGDKDVVGLGRGSVGEGVSDQGLEKVIVCVRVVLGVLIFALVRRVVPRVRTLLVWLLVLV